MTSRVHALLAVAMAACDTESTMVHIEGSSTVFPITVAIEEPYRASNSGPPVAIRVTGTTAGLRTLCAGESDVAEASRSIEAEEIEACRKAGVDFIELPIAYDGLAIVAPRTNEWLDALTTEELRHIWAPAAEGTITRWSQVRDGFPDLEIRLFGPGADSGTFDYFTKAIVGEERSSRTDYTSSENDDVIVRGVSGAEGALGYLGLAYFAQHQESLKLVAVDDGNPTNGDGPVIPSADSVRDGTYQPLARPLFLYVNRASLDRRGVGDFVEFYIRHVAEVANQVGYISLPADAYVVVAKRLSARRAGTALAGSGPTVGIDVARLLADPIDE